MSGRSGTSRRAPVREALTMAYDEDLAERVRSIVAPLTTFDELKMFGGLAFMVNTHMACGIIGDDLMVRVGKQGHDEAIRSGAREMDFTGRPMRGLVMVDGDGLDEESFTSWVESAVAFAQSEKPKPPKPPRRQKPPGT
jgi:TfoX/Sxy family transcriptional regulator of competence genes